MMVPGKTAPPPSYGEGETFGARLIAAVKDAIAGNFASVTVDGQRWVPQPKGYRLVPQVALNWLFGEGPDAQGLWFGDRIPQTGRPRAYWWRSVFRKMIDAPSPPASPKGDGE